MQRTMLPILAVALALLIIVSYITPIWDVLLIYNKYNLHILRRYRIKVWER